MTTEEVKAPTPTTTTLDDVLDGLTLETAFIAEVKRRTNALMLDHFADIRDRIAWINLDNSLSDDERKRMRKVYELVLQKIDMVKA